MQKRVAIYLAVLTVTLFAGWWWYGSLVLNLPRYRYQFARWEMEHFGDRLDRTSRSLAGWRAVDCGHTRLRGDANPAIDCALYAFREHRAFRVRFDLQGINSSPSQGVVFTPAGEVVELFYDRRSSDSLLHGYWVNERLYQRHCSTPVKLVVEREPLVGAWVECSPTAQSQSELNHGK